MHNNNFEIAIVGAGIGGLSLALALREKGIKATLYEQADALREVGAAVALSANATRFYHSVGLGPQFAAVCADVSTLVYRDARDGRVIGHHSGEPDYASQFGANYYGIHRADLQQILSQAVGMENIHLKKRVCNIKESAKEAVLEFADGSSARADLLIGADGARSKVRELMLGYDDALYSGCSGFRGIVSPDKLDLLPDPAAIQFWMAPGRHLLHYPIGNGDQNFLLVERNPSPWPVREWTMPAAEGEHLARLDEWHPAIQQMLSSVPTGQRWALFHRPPLGRWSRGRITLLGDAAHALVPHHGQGANQSIEDAVVLAAQLAKHGLDNHQAAREAYEQLRRGRTRKVQFASISTADILHLPDGPAAEQRNARLASREGIMHHLAWIHEFDPATDIPSERQGGTWL